MGKITFIVEGTTVGTVAEGAGFTTSYEVTEANSARLIAAMADYHSGDLANIESPGIPDILKAWFDSCINQALRQTADYEKRNEAFNLTITEV